MILMINHTGNTESNTLRIGGMNNYIHFSESSGMNSTAHLSDIYAYL